MSTARLGTIGMMGLVAVLMVTGCGPSPEELQIQALNEQIHDLQQENDSLRSRLAAALSERDAARARALALQQENNELRRELANVPEPEPDRGPWVKRGEYRWIDLGSDILFDSGKASLKPAGKAKLQEIAADINSYYSDKMVWIIGHTDSDPIKHSAAHWKDNLDLSQGRSATVYRELIQFGVDPQRLVAGGQGENNPVAANDSKANKARNRRVDFIAVPVLPTASGDANTRAVRSEMRSARPADSAGPNVPIDQVIVK